MYTAFAPEGILQYPHLCVKEKSTSDCFILLHSAAVLSSSSIPTSPRFIPLLSMFPCFTLPSFLSLIHFIALSFSIVWFSAKGHHSLYESMHVIHHFFCGCSFCLRLSWCSIFWAGSLGYQCWGQQLLSNRWEHYHVKAKALCCTP